MGKARTALESVESSLRVSFAICSQSSETSRIPHVPSLTALNVEGKHAQDHEGAMKLGQPEWAYDLDVGID